MWGRVSALLTPTAKPHVRQGFSPADARGIVSPSHDKGDPHAPYLGPPAAGAARIRPRAVCWPRGRFTRCRAPCTAAHQPGEARTPRHHDESTRADLLRPGTAARLLLQPRRGRALVPGGAAAPPGKRPVLPGRGVRARPERQRSAHARTREGSPRRPAEGEGA